MKDINDWSFDDLMSQCAWSVSQSIIRGERLTSSMVSVFNLILGWQREKGLGPRESTNERDGLELLPSDLRTHIQDWEKACKIARDAADEEDKSYWKHQLKTLTKIKAAIKEQGYVP